MTDLFASLVDRALDRAPVLQRRQPTLFEPVAEAAFSEQSQFGNVSWLEEKETVVERRTPAVEPKHFVNNDFRPPRLSSREEPESPPVQTQPVSRHPSNDAGPRSQNDRDNADAGFISSSKEPTEVISRKTSPTNEFKKPAVVKPEAITVVPPRLIETIVERRVEREIIKEHSTDTPAIKEVRNSAQPNNQPKPQRDNDGSQPKQPLKVEVKRSTPPEQKIIKPSTQRKPVPRRDPPTIARAASRVESSLPTRQPMPPVIQVTIGRVEVRATPLAAARPHAARPTGPKMNLEDYLRSRGEGN